MSSFLAQLDNHLKENSLSSKQCQLIRDFYTSYQKGSTHFISEEEQEKTFKLLTQLMIEQVKNPHSFSIFHRSIRHPFDYYRFGNDFIRPFIDFKQSEVVGLHNLKKIEGQLEKKENVFLFANHQTEPDPQIISLLLENLSPKLAMEMVFVAGHRVITDPIAIPMSLGRNLLCIYSKKHISDPPEEKADKILHNQRTLKQMGELLNEGGYCIYVAPSGGRDRSNEKGVIEIAPFDPQSLELFFLISQHAAPPSHFYPLSLKTYHLMPPPRVVEKELGERRIIQRTPVHLAFGEEVDMEHFPGSESLEKRARREKRAEWIWLQVCQNYDAFSPL